MIYVKELAANDVAYNDGGAQVEFPRKQFGNLWNSGDVTISVKYNRDGVLSETTTVLTIPDQGNFYAREYSRRNGDRSPLKDFFEKVLKLRSSDIGSLLIFEDIDGDGLNFELFLYKPKSKKKQLSTSFSILPLQRIFYGAPGTGKSNTIKREVEDKGRVHFRTTFHPDSDYSTFVGCYKPTMVEAPVRDGSGHEVANAKPEEKNRISYSFVPQAFAKAYCEAWNKYDGSENAEPVFLIIEEINRGNCAQIFGDIFQLLDREMEGARCGFSTYPIDADEDLKAFLEDGVKRDGTPWLTNKEGIKDGKLCLPPNLYIWATMNTSDQSLFPIDSAFKRRWDWKYVPIDTKKENWTIKIGDKDYSWSSFLEKINEEIDRTTHSEDKMLGFYFCRANNGVIDADKFVSKVLFYIYNDVFKDYGFDREMFKDEDGKVISFKSYYNTDGTINESKVERFLDNLTKDKE